MSSVAARRLAEPLKWDEPSGDHLRGLAVQLSDGCPSCGSRDAIIGKGKGPCHAALFCTRCARHRGWVPNQAHAFVTEVVKKFGRPITPIRIQRKQNAGEQK